MQETQHDPVLSIKGVRGGGSSGGLLGQACTGQAASRAVPILTLERTQGLEPTVSSSAFSFFGQR